MQGPELPIALFGHALINIGNEKTMIIGGFTGSSSSAQTFIYNNNHGNWSYGPSLILARYEHAAGIVTDEVTHETHAIVTGGYSGGYLKSTEILKGGSWTLGEKIDKNLYQKNKSVKSQVLQEIARLCKLLPRCYNFVDKLKSTEILKAHLICLT